MDIELRGTQVRLPDFFVIGAPKSATTSLYQFLFKHKIIGLKHKEPHYLVYKDLGIDFEFASGDTRINFLTDLESYLNLFNSNPTQFPLLADFSTQYLRFSEIFIDNIRELYQHRIKDIKIVIVVRDPIKRAFSHYAHNVRENREPLSFKDAIAPGTIYQRMAQNYFPFYDYVRFSQYEDDIRRIQTVFRNVLIIKFEDFVLDQSLWLDKLLNFLNIEINDTTVFPTTNISGRPSQQAFKKLLYHCFYTETSLKQLIPVKFKRRIRRSLKNEVDKLILDKLVIQPDEHEFARHLLENEYRISSFYC